MVSAVFSMKVRTSRGFGQPVGLFHVDVEGLLHGEADLVLLLSRLPTANIPSAKLVMPPGSASCSNTRTEAPP